MRTPQTLRDPEQGDSYSIGWALYENQGQSIIAHAGGHWGFSVKAEVLRDLKLGVVIMTNCNYPQGYIGPEKELTKIIWEKFVPILTKKKTDTAFDSKKVELQQYSGRYAIPGQYAHAELQIRNDTLFFSLKEKPGFTAAIVPVGLNQFCFAIDPGKHPMFQFTSSAEGKIVALKFLEYSFKKE